MTEIPNAFGGFAPFPNTIMIPTMGLQSAVIGYRFGFGYEQGKRTLRAMSNEQFNNLDEEAEQAIFKRHDSAAINYFKTEMNNWVELQNLIIEKSVEIEVMKAIRTPSAFREMFEGFTKGFTDQQGEDAKSFFASLSDPIMKLMAWFSGHKGSSTTTVTQPTTVETITDEGTLAPPPVEFPKSIPKPIPKPVGIDKTIRKSLSFKLLKLTAKGAKWLNTNAKLNYNEMVSLHKNQIKMVALANSKRWLTPFELQQSMGNLNAMNKIILEWV